MILQGKNAIITGGSLGIGKAIAERFAAEGARLLLASRTERDLETVRDSIRSGGGQVDIFPMDVSVPGDVKRLFAHAEETMASIDILVNSSGIYGPIGMIPDIDAEEWHEAMDINLYGTFLCMRAALPGMMAQKKGKIVNMSGGGAASPFPRFTAYGTSKAGVVRLTETVATEVRDYNIDINAIAPGAVNTRFLDQALAAGDAAGKEFHDRSVKQKEQGGVPPEQVAELALFLSSPESDGLSGRLISLLWDNWKDIPKHIEEIKNSDVYTLRRIIPEERGFDW